MLLAHMFRKCENNYIGRYVYNSETLDSSSKILFALESLYVLSSLCTLMSFSTTFPLRGIFT